MIIVGMTGPIGHGKSSLAQAFAKLEPKSKQYESGLIIAEVADDLHAQSHFIPESSNLNDINKWLEPLPAILKNRVHVNTSLAEIAIKPEEVESNPADFDKLFTHLENLKNDPELFEHNITIQNKEKYRPLLQWLGGYLVKKTSPGIWYNEIVRRIQDPTGPAVALSMVGGLRYPRDAEIIRSAGGVVIKIYRPDAAVQDIADPTERERDNIATDTTFVNNGSLDELNARAKQILEDIKSSNIKTEYYAKKQL